MQSERENTIAAENCDTRAQGHEKTNSNERRKKTNHLHLATFDLIVPLFIAYLNIIIKHKDW